MSCRANTVHRRAVQTYRCAFTCACNASLEWRRSGPWRTKAVLLECSRASCPESVQNFLGFLQIAKVFLCKHRNKRLWNPINSACDREMNSRRMNNTTTLKGSIMTVPSHRRSFNYYRFLKYSSLCRSCHSINFCEVYSAAFLSSRSMTRAKRSRSTFSLESMIV